MIPTALSAQMGGAVNPGVHVGGTVNPRATVLAHAYASHRMSPRQFILAVTAGPLLSALLLWLMLAWLLNAITLPVG
jgi:hypothetical protein